MQGKFHGSRCSHKRVIFLQTTLKTSQERTHLLHPVGISVPCLPAFGSALRPLPLAPVPVPTPSLPGSERAESAKSANRAENAKSADRAERREERGQGRAPLLFCLWFGVLGSF